MKFCWCTLMVKNMEESLKFYQEIVGLKIDRRLNAGPNGEIVFLGDGETKVELISNQNKTETDMGKDITLGFEVDSIDKMVEFVKEKGMEFQGPFQPSPIVKFFYVKDPNGTKIQFVENL
jgi:lactoylglutathione lyase